MKIINTYHFGVSFGTKAKILAVLLSDGKRFVSYMGVCELPAADAKNYDAEREAMAERIAATGQKLNWKQADAFFRSAGLTEENYNR